VNILPTYYAVNSYRYCSLTNEEELLMLNKYCAKKQHRQENDAWSAA